MKVLRNFGFAVTAALMLAGCGREATQSGGTGAIVPQEEASENEIASAPKDEGQAIVFANNKVQISVPDGWFPNGEENPFDVQYIAPRQNMNTGVFVYNFSDLEEGMTTQDVFTFHLEDLRSKRENFTPVEPKKTETEQDKTITTATFSGDKDGDENYYKFTLVEFVEDSDFFLVFLQISFPEEWEDSNLVFLNIARSAKKLPPAQ